MDRLSNIFNEILLEAPHIELPDTEFEEGGKQFADLKLEELEALRLTKSLHDEDFIRHFKEEVFDLLPTIFDMRDLLAELKSNKRNAYIKTHMENSFQIKDFYNILDSACDKSVNERIQTDKMDRVKRLSTNKMKNKRYRKDFRD